MSLRRITIVLMSVVAFAVAAIAGFLLVAYLIGAIGAVPRLPEAPELDDVDLTPPAAGPRSEALHRALSRRYPALDSLDDDFLYEQMQSIYAGAWPGEPLVTLAKSAQASELTTTIRSALGTPGCIHPEPFDMAEFLESAGSVDSPPPSPPPRMNAFLLKRAIEVMVISEVARAEAGQTVEATEGIVTLLRQVMRLQHECPNDSGLTIVLEACFNVLHASLAFVIANPDDESEAWQLAIDLERAESPMPAVFRQDRALLLQQLEAEATRAEGDPGEAAFLALLDRGHKRGVWLAELPASHAALRTPSPEEEYATALQEQSRLVMVLGGAALPAAMIVLGTVHMDRSQIQMWHSDRCRLALRRAQWQRELLARGRALPAHVAASPPRDRFTDRNIDLDGDRRGLCGRDEDMTNPEEGRRWRLPDWPPPSRPAPESPTEPEPSMTNAAAPTPAL